MLLIPSDAACSEPGWIVSYRAFQRKESPLAEKGQRLGDGHPRVTLGSIHSSAGPPGLGVSAPAWSPLLTDCERTKAAGPSPHSTGTGRTFGSRRVPDLPNPLTPRNLPFQLPLGPTRTGLSKPLLESTRPLKRRVHPAQPSPTVETCQVRSISDKASQVL